METPVRIDFHGVEPSEAIKNRIAEHIEGIETLYGRVMACHVGVETPGHHHRTGGLFHIRIRLGLPNGREVNVGTTPRADERHADVLFAINDAFRRARRQLQDQVREMRRQVKAHDSMPMGTIASFDPNTGYGFIRASDGHEVYFHRNSMLEGRPSRIRPGARVSFVEEIGEKGPQASTVHPLGKHALR